MEPQLVSDQLEIYNLQTRYSLTIDSGDYDGLDDVFTAEGVADYSPAGFASTLDLREIKESCRVALEPLTSVQHTNGNHWADIDGDRARAGCYFRVHMFLEGTPGGEHFEMGGKYEDDLVRTADGWRIERRKLSILSADGNRDVRYGENR
jgi:hypothetical protein